MRAADDLKEMLSSKEGQEAYVAWVDSPVTQRFFRVLQDLVRPHPVPVDRALEELGRCLGVSQALDIMLSPQAAVGLVSPMAEFGKLVADYGARHILATDVVNGKKGENK